jgi:hypothetical protein
LRRCMSPEMARRDILHRHANWCKAGINERAGLDGLSRDFRVAARSGGRNLRLIFLRLTSVAGEEHVATGWLGTNADRSSYAAR